MCAWVQSFNVCILSMFLHSEYLCYDDACHLRKYSLNPCRRDLTQTTKILSDLTMAVDKMHMAGHVDSWCKKTCDPHLFSDLNEVFLSMSIVYFEVLFYNLRYKLQYRRSITTCKGGVPQFYKADILVQYYVVVVQHAHCMLVSSKQKYVTSMILSYTASSLHDRLTRKCVNKYFRGYLDMAR